VVEEDIQKVEQEYFSKHPHKKRSFIVEYGHRMIVNYCQEVTVEKLTMKN
jgi:hypothetical protein